MNTLDNNAFMTDKFTLKPSPQVVERVREFLNEQLQHQALDCENIYLNTINNIVDMTVIYSQDLLGLGMDTLEWGTVQAHNDWETGVFSKGGSFQDIHRLDHLPIERIEQMMSELLDQAKYKWMV